MNTVCGFCSRHLHELLSIDCIFVSDRFCAAPIGSIFCVNFAFSAQKTNYCS